jgi:hypothetical protein
MAQFDQMLLPATLEVKAIKALAILQNDIPLAYPAIHSVRLDTLFTCVGAAMRDQRVSFTYLAAIPDLSVKPRFSIL